MNANNLARYLNNHLAGAKASVDLLEALSQRPDHGERWNMFLQLHAEIAEDMRVLEGLIAQLGMRESPLCGAAGKVTSIAGRMKLMWDGWDDGDLGLLEALEVLQLGVAGKRLLWASLQEVASLHPVLGRYDFGAFLDSAKRQERALEAHRLLEAREALGEGEAV